MDGLERMPIMARGFRVVLTLASIIFLAACAPQPQTHPLDTAPIPANARILEEPCSSLGVMLCGGVSTLSGETAIERRSACIAYVEPSGRRVEQCGSLPLSQSNPAHESVDQNQPVTQGNR